MLQKAVQILSLIRYSDILYTSIPYLLQMATNSLCFSVNIVRSTILSEQCIFIHNISLRCSNIRYNGRDLRKNLIRHKNYTITCKQYTLSLQQHENIRLKQLFHAVFISCKLFDNDHASHPYSKVGKQYIFTRCNAEISFYLHELVIFRISVHTSVTCLAQLIKQGAWAVSTFTLDGQWGRGI